MLKSPRDARLSAERARPRSAQLLQYSSPQSSRASANDLRRVTASLPSEHMLNAARADIEKRYLAAGFTQHEAQEQGRNFVRHAAIASGLR